MKSPTVSLKIKFIAHPPSQSQSCTVFQIERKKIYIYIYSKFLLQPPLICKLSKSPVSELQDKDPDFEYFLGGVEDGKGTPDRHSWSWYLCQDSVHS